MIGRHFHGDAALPHQDHGAEGGVRRDADDQFMRLRPARHLLHRKTVDQRVGTHAAHALEHGGGGRAQDVGRVEVQRHAAHVGFVGDIGRMDLQRDGIADVRRHGQRRFHVGRHARGGHGNAVGGQNLFRAAFAEHRLASRQRGGDDFAHAGAARRGRHRQLRRHLHQGFLVAPVLHDLHEAMHGLFRRVVGGNAGAVEDLARGRHGGAAQQARQHRARGGLDQRRDGFGDVDRRNHGRGRVQQQQGVRLRLVEQRLDGVGIALHGRVAGQADGVVVRPAPWQGLFQRDHGIGRQFGQLAAAAHQRIGGHHAQAAAIAQDRQALAPLRADVRERFHGVEQFLGRIHAQHAGAADGRVVHGVGTGQRARMPGRHGRAFRLAPRLQHDDGLAARGRPRRRHEFARRLDVFHVQQDGGRVGIAGQVVEQVAEIDVVAAAERNELGKAHAMRVGPVEHARHQRARLRHEGDLAGRRPHVGKAGVQAQSRHEQPHAVGAEDAQQMRLGRLQHGQAQRLLAHGVDAGSHDDGRARAQRAQFADQRRDGGRRRADDGQVRRLGQLRQLAVAFQAHQLVILGIDGPDLSLVAASQQVVQGDGAQLAFARRGADQGHRGRLEQLVEITDTHVLASWIAGAGLPEWLRQCIGCVAKKI